MGRVAGGLGELMSTDLVILYLTKKPHADKTGDQLAEDVAKERYCHLVARTERHIYAHALRRAEERARAKGYAFKVLDAEQALVEVSIPKNVYFTHHVKKYVRVIRPSFLVGRV